MFPYLSVVLKFYSYSFLSLVENNLKDYSVTFRRIFNIRNIRENKFDIKG